MKTTFWRGLAATSALFATTHAAFAHHAMGGGLPASAGDGLISGFAHPVIGFDHLAFIIAVGILAAICRTPVWAPLLFVGGTVLGSLAALAGFELAITEWLILASIVLLGGMLMAGFSTYALWAFAALGAAGLFHGMAYAEAVIGAEPTPVIAYLLGFAAIQSVIVTGVALAASALWQNEKLALNARLAGAVVAGIGLTFAVEGVEGLLFPGVA